MRNRNWTYVFFFFCVADFLPSFGEVTLFIVVVFFGVVALLAIISFFSAFLLSMAGIVWVKLCFLSFGRAGDLTGFSFLSIGDVCTAAGLALFLFEGDRFSVSAAKFEKKPRI